MKRLLVSLLVVAAIIWLAFPSFVSAADSCASLREKRKAAFYEHLTYLKRARADRSELGSMNTVDPAVIKAQFDRFAALDKEARETMQRATPNEKKMFAKHYTAIEDAYDFWRAKKAHEETGGMIDVPSATRYREYAQSSLKSNEGMERALSAELAQLDREIKKCEAGQGSKDTVSSIWNGDWTEGPGVIYRISGTNTTISYSVIVGGNSVGQGRCTVNGNVAVCQWTEANPETHDDARIIRNTSGHGNLTLNGSRLRAHFVVDTVNFDPPCPIFDCGPPKPGWVNDYILERKP